MNSLRWVLPGFVLGLLLALSPSCGEPEAKCNASTCPSGCCTADGRCDPGNQSNACGLAGSLCQACGATDHCSGGVCTPLSGQVDGGVQCSPTNCGTCCKNNACVPAAQLGEASCGLGGQVCETCASGRICSAGVCQEGSCTGCTSNGVCLQPGQQNNAACGLTGTCQACPSGTTCQDGSCQSTSTCNAGSCTTCCRNGQCVGAVDNLNCGAGGGACETCTGNQACTTGQCVDQGCAAGCINNGACLSTGQQTASACGTGGVSCQACAAGATCTNGTCVGGTCSGCMQGGSCIELNQQSTSACGQGGAVCVACPSGTACQNGQCTSTSTCTPSSCPGGCCSAEGFCLPGSTTNSCGTGGAACATCVTGQSCTSGSCQTTTTATYGSACSTSTQCAGLGTGAVCKQATNPGGAAYSGGFCTVLCASDPTMMCGASAICLSAGPFGESDQICAPRCNATADCRTPGYDCYQVGTAVGNNACWISPLPTVTVVPAPDHLVGNACTTDAACQAGGAFPDGWCYPELHPTTGAPTGFAGGYCTAECLNDPSICGNTSVCLNLGTAADPWGMCIDSCAAPGTGQSDCRTGYVCEQLQSGAGVCWMNCNNPGAGCGTTATCNAQGYCQ